MAMDTSCTDVIETLHLHCLSRNVTLNLYSMLNKYVHLADNRRIILLIKANNALRDIKMLFPIVNPLLSEFLHCTAFPRTVNKSDFKKPK